MAFDFVNSVCVQSLPLRLKAISIDTLLCIALKVVGADTSLHEHKLEA